jgi:hypothetical protein
MCCGRGDASSSPIDSHEIKCFSESKGITVYRSEFKGTTENFDKLGRYEVYVVSPQLKEELGIALIDSGSMVSLVKESSVKRFRNQKEQILLQGITGKQMNVLGLIDLKIENVSEPLVQKCHVVDRLPRNLGII